MMLSGTSRASLLLQTAEEFKFQLNPFQRPGQRQIPMYRLPNVVNGFTLIVYKKAKTKDLEDGKVGVEVERIALTLCYIKLDELD